MGRARACGAGWARGSRTARPRTARHCVAGSLFTAWRLLTRTPTAYSLSLLQAQTDGSSMLRPGTRALSPARIISGRTDRTPQRCSASLHGSSAGQPRGTGSGRCSAQHSACRARHVLCLVHPWYNFFSAVCFVALSGCGGLLHGDTVTPFKNESLTNKYLE